jgi:hypothetical protein
LRELTEPVCPFEKYPDFRDINKLLSPSQKLDLIVTLLRDLPELNRSTLLYLARFFNKVSSYSAKNLMNAYNVAVIITPNLFRSRELTSKDLLNHGTLTDVFTLIMANVDRIIKDINQDEKNPDTLVNQLLADKNNELSKSNRTNNRQTVQQGFNPQKSEAPINFADLMNNL